MINVTFGSESWSYQDNDTHWIPWRRDGSYRRECAYPREGRWRTCPPCPPCRTWIRGCAHCPTNREWTRSGKAHQALRNRCKRDTKFSRATHAAPRAEQLITHLIEGGMQRARTKGQHMHIACGIRSFVFRISISVTDRHTLPWAASMCNDTQLATSCKITYKVVETAYAFARRSSEIFSSAEIFIHSYIFICAFISGPENETVCLTHAIIARCLAESKPTRVEFQS